MMPSLKASARGFSLVELMVALAIGLVLATLLATIFANSSRSQKEITLAAQQVENGRYAIELLSEDLRHAGYYGHYFSLPAASALTDPCSVTLADLRAGIALPVQGYDSAASSPLSCIDDDNFVAGTDILVIRRVSTGTTAAASLVNKVVYLQSTASPNVTTNPVIDLGSSAAAFNLQIRNGSGANVAAPIRKLDTHIYFVAPCSTPTGSGNTKCTAGDDGGAPIPTLKRLELSVDASGNTAMVTYPLVEGVQNLQVEYALDTDGDGSPNGGFATNPGAAASWQNVMSVALYVLARNTQPSAGYVDNKTYSMGSTAVAAPGDGFRRHLYTAAVRVKNQSERRDTP
jgi:type IV pilus assembly protein PilW